MKERIRRNCTPSFICSATTQLTPIKSLSDLTDIDIAMSSLDSTLFPGVPSSVEGHAGFIAEHAKTAATILAETKKLISSTGATQVILVSHSSLVDRIYRFADGVLRARSVTPSEVHLRSSTRCS